MLDYETKKKLLTYLYQHVNMNIIKRKPLNTPETLEQLKNGKYYVGPNYRGVLCYILFCKNGDNYSSYVINRKNLKANFRDLEINNAEIQDLKIKATRQVYSGTIFESILIIKKLEKKTTYEFKITDVLVMGGTNMEKEDLKKKLEKFQIFITDNFNFKKTNIIFSIENLVEYGNALGNLIFKDIRKSEYRINGLLFYPKISGMRIFWNEHETQRNNNQEENEKFINKQNLDLYDSPKAVFLLKKSKTVDVYPIFLLKKKELEKQGNAYIPTIDCSKFCRNVFKTKSEALFTCFYKKGKWIPGEVSNQEKPDKYSDVMELINRNVKPKIRD